jgi:hypothetical protein
MEVLPDSIVNLVPRFDLAPFKAWLESHDPHMRDRHGKTLYHHAYRYQSHPKLFIPLIWLLLKCGYDPNHAPWISSMSANWRPLHYAANMDHLRIIRFLLSRGAVLDAANSGGLTAEQMIVYRQPRDDAYFLLRAVRLAGGWKRYVNAPRKDMLVLRELCARGRAAPPSALAALFCTTGFAPSRPRTRRNPRVAPLPTPIFWHVLSYWRSDRDFDPSAA